MMPPENPDEEPASKADVKQVIERVDTLEQKIKQELENSRVQQSHELGSLYTLGQNILAGVIWLKNGWRRFGILSTPPEDKPPKGDA